MFSGKRLKERRIVLGYSQSAMADKLNINRSSYFNWEIGKTRPNQKIFLPLQGYLMFQQPILNRNTRL